MLTDLIKKVDVFVAKWGANKTQADTDKMKSDLLDLVQDAIDHGADKDQNKISGIIGKVVKSFMGGKD